MEALLADENFNERLLADVERRLGALDILLAKSIGLRSQPDPIVLARAAELGRVLLTHDEKTVIPAAIDRVRRGLVMPGVVFVPWELDRGRALNDLEVVLGCGLSSDFDSQVLRLPY